MRGYASIGLCSPKSDVNVGGVLRASYIYGASLVVLQPRSSRVRYSTDTMKGRQHVPIIRTDDLMSCIPFDCIPVAVEITEDAVDLVHYKHPERAYYILGPEDGSVPGRILDRCAHVVQIPTKGCMNLAATANVLLYDRMAKEAQRENRRNREAG